MFWERVDAAARENIDEEANYVVVTNAGKWGDQCQSLTRGWCLKQMLNEQLTPDRPGRSKVVCYAQVQFVTEIIDWANGKL